MTTQAPNLELVKRQAQNFIGYTSPEWAALTCGPGYTYSETKPFGLYNPGYGGCCATTFKTCYPWTTCALGTLYGTLSNLPCGPGSSCVTGIAATSEGAELDGDLCLFCGTGSGWIAYRTPPNVAPTTTSVLSTPQQIPPITTSQISQTISPIASTSLSITTSSLPTNGTTGAAGNVSGVAIAGAVIGPVCGVALLLGLVFLCLRHRRSKPPAAHRPVSILPTYPGTENVETTVAMKDMPSPTMWYSTNVAAHSPITIGQQSEAQVQPQIQSQQVPARRPVMAELRANPPVRGMLPEMPVSTGYFVNTV